MPERPIVGRSRVSRRAVGEIVRTAVVGSYGVTGFVDDGPVGKIRRFLGIGRRGIKVSRKGPLSVELRLTVAYGLPIAEVARQVESAVRYAVRRALDQEVAELAIHIGGLRYEPASLPPVSEPAVRTTPGTGAGGDAPDADPPDDRDDRPDETRVGTTGAAGWPGDGS